MQAVGMAVTVDGTNDDLARPLGFACSKTGVTISMGPGPSDSDLSEVTWDDLYGDLGLLAEYRVLCNCRNRWTKVRIQIDVDEHFLSDLRDSLDKRIAAMEKMDVIKDAVSVSTLTAGSITLGNMFEEEEVFT